MEGNPSDPKDFGHEAMQHARVATAHKIAWFLERTGGTDLSWWNAVKAGEQDPFEKMQWAEGVKGAGQLASVNDDQLPDDTVLTL
jgi:hypothetical protein